MDALQELATFAASHRIRGRSYKRNSMLKPLDIILNELDRCPNPKDPAEIRLVRTGSKGLIYEHVQRVAKGVREDAVYHYVDLFFDQVLEEAHHYNANKLLQREHLIRSEARRSRLWVPRSRSRYLKHIGVARVNARCAAR